MDNHDLTSMQRIHYGRYNPGDICPFSEAFFDALKSNMKNRAVVHLARQNGKLISYSLVLKGKNRWHMFLSGDADDELAHVDKLHFNLNYYFPIRQAITTGISQLDYGLSGYDTKVRRGCRLEPISIFLRGNTLFLRWGLPVWMRLVNWRYRF